MDLGGICSSTFFDRSYNVSLVKSQWACATNTPWTTPFHYHALLWTAPTFFSIDPTPRINSKDSYELIVGSGFMNSLFYTMLLSTKQVVDIFRRPTHPPDLPIAAFMQQKQHHQPIKLRLSILITYARGMVAWFCQILSVSTPQSILWVASMRRRRVKIPPIVRGCSECFCLCHINRLILEFLDRLE